MTLKLRVLAFLADRSGRCRHRSSPNQNIINDVMISANERIHILHIGRPDPAVWEYPILVVFLKRNTELTMTTRSRQVMGVTGAGL